MVYLCDCPVCGYPQYCGCDSCKNDVPDGIMPQIWFDSDMELIQCPNCKAVFSAEDWECIDVFQKYLFVLDILKLRPDITHYEEKINMLFNDEFEDFADTDEYTLLDDNPYHYFNSPNYKYLWDELLK